MRIQNALLVLFLAIGGCASTPDVADREVRIGAAAAAFDRPFTYFYIPSEGAIEDTAFIAMSKTTGSSGMARQLAGLMSAASQSPLRVVVTGPSREKNERVVLDAVAALAGKSLPRLQFLFLGNATYEAKIRSAIEPLDAEFFFAPY